MARSANHTRRRPELEHRRVLRQLAEQRRSEQIQQRVGR